MNSLTMAVKVEKLEPSVRLTFEDCKIKVFELSEMHTEKSPWKDATKTAHHTYNDITHSQRYKVNIS